MYLRSSLLQKPNILISANCPWLLSTAFLHISRSWALVCEPKAVSMWMTFHIAGSLQILRQVVHTFCAFSSMSITPILWSILDAKSDGRSNHLLNDAFTFGTVLWFKAFCRSDLDAHSMIGDSIFAFGTDLGFLAFCWSDFDAHSLIGGSICPSQIENTKKESIYICVYKLVRWL